MSDDLRSRIGAAIAHQHAEGALVGAEVDAVMEIIDERDTATMEIVVAIGHRVDEITRKVDDILALRALLEPKAGA